jgi:hypothetical protein
MATLAQIEPVNMLAALEGKRPWVSSQETYRIGSADYGSTLCFASEEHRVRL